MVYPQTLVQATTLFHLSQQMQAATTPEDLLRVFIEPVWRKGNCSAVLAYLDRRLEDVDDWTAEILASIAASEPTISLSPIGARYRASAVPMLRTLFSDREMIRVYDLNTSDHPFDAAALDTYRQQRIQRVCIILLKKPGEQVIGCVALRWSESWTMEAEARQILTALAPGMAIMVDNLWSSAQRERTLQLTEAAVLRLTDELRVKAALLEEADRELEAFTYSVSHDLRAPLRALDGFSRILTDTYREQIPEQAVRYLDRVRANATQMGALIDGLLTLSRVGKRHLETRLCDMRTTAQRAFQEVQEGHETESVTFILSALPPCQGDPEMVAQVFAHLLSNAVKFSHGRPEMTIEVGVEDKAQGYPVYFVRDNGIGFDMEYANKIFGVFQRLHDPRQHEGTGVGLAIVNRIIYRHGGRIWVSSVPNVGTTFYFTLEGERDARSAS